MNVMCDNDIFSLSLTLNMFLKEEIIDLVWKYLTALIWVWFEDAKSISFFNLQAVAKGQKQSRDFYSRFVEQLEQELSKPFLSIQTHVQNNINELRLLPTLSS